MKILPTFLFVFFAATSASRPAWAQGVPPATTTTISPRHQQAAEAMVNMIASAESYNQTIDQMLVMQLNQNPSMKKVEPEMRAFFNKYMGWEIIRPEMATIYAREFTEPELREIIKFYQTPVGQKMAARLPQLMQAGMEVSQRRVQEHLPELQKMIQDKMAAEK